MKRIISLTLCMALVALCLSGCVVVNIPGVGAVIGRGDAERFEFNVGEFTAIHVGLFCNIEYYSAPSGTVTLDIQPNLAEYVKVERIGNVLTVRSTRDISMPGSTVPVLTVSAPTLHSLTLEGAGNFTAHDKIIADSFALELSGAFTGSAELDVDSILVDISGAGSFDLSGRADTANLSLSGAGNLDALALITREADVSLSGMGTVRISCSDNLRIDAGGMGTVEYMGSPSIDLDSSGTVTVKQIGEIMA